MANVFISYSKSDAAWVRRVADALRARGVSVWWDTTGLAPGGEFATEIERQLDAADHVLVLWSRSSAHSEWVRDEADHAKRNGKLVSAIIDDLDLPPIGFRQRHAPSLKGWNGDAADPQFALVLEAVGVAPASSASSALRTRRQFRQRPAAKEWAGPIVLVFCIAIFMAVRADLLLKVPIAPNGTFWTNIWPIEGWIGVALAGAAALAALSLRRATTLFLGAAIAVSAAVTFDDGVFAQLEPVAAALEIVGSANAQEASPGTDAAALLQAAQAAAPDAEASLQAQSRSHMITSSISGWIVCAFGALFVWAWRRGVDMAWWGLVALAGVAFALRAFQPGSMSSTVFGDSLSPLLFSFFNFSALALCAIVAYVVRRTGMIE